MSRQEQDGLCSELVGLTLGCFRRITSIPRGPNTQDQEPCEVDICVHVGHVNVNVMGKDRAQVCTTMADIAAELQVEVVQGCGMQFSWDKAFLLSSDKDLVNSMATTLSKYGGQIVTTARRLGVDYTLQRTGKVNMPVHKERIKKVQKRIRKFRYYIKSSGKTRVSKQV